MKIVLDSGQELTLSAEQQASLDAFVDHPSNKIGWFNPVAEAMEQKRRWETPDEWWQYQWTNLLKGVMATCKPPSVASMQAQIDLLQSQMRDAAMPVAAP